VEGGWLIGSLISVILTVAKQFEILKVRDIESEFCFKIFSIKCHKLKMLLRMLR